jgi:hypothetical protein
VDASGAGGIDVVEDETVVRCGHETSVSLGRSDARVPRWDRAARDERG